MIDSIEEFAANEEEYIQQWPLVGSTAPIFAIFFTYLLFAKKVGPKWMKNREVMDLKGVMMAYNLFQIVLSCWLVYMNMQGYKVFLQFTTRIGYMQTHQNYLNNGPWWYFITKIVELLDTIFMILRKKESQISFLHLYHHSCMLLYTWFFIKFYPGDHLLFGCLFNSFVHIIMYTYYFLAGLGPGVQKYLWWKKYLTVLQIVQFGTGIFYLIVTIMVDSNDDQKMSLYLQLVLAIAFLCLFGNFYKSSYGGTKTKESV